MNPLISIVIPAYNAGKFLSEALDSAFRQTVGAEHLEIIVVDDGSTDESRRIAEAALSRTSIRHSVLSHANGGPAKARNAGWRHCAGEWIQFLDADDVLSPGKLELQGRWAKSASQDIAVIYSPWQRLRSVNGTWQRASDVRVPAIGKDAVSDLLHDANVIATGSQLIRRRWLEKVSGFEERFWLIEDVDLLLRIAMAGGRFECALSDSPLFYYRQHDTGSLSRRDQREFVDGCIRNAEMVEEFWRSRNQLTAGRARQLAEAYLGGSRYFAASDIPRFNLLVQRIEGLVPGFTPAKPQRLRQLSRILGYRRAELLSVQYRRAKAVFLGGSTNRRESRSAKSAPPVNTV